MICFEVKNTKLELKKFQIKRQIYCVKIGGIYRLTIKIATDASMDLPSDLIEKYEIAVIPMTVHFGEEKFSVPDGVSSEYLYQKMHENKGIIPTTSVPSPKDYYDVYKNETNDGSTLIAIHVSSKISGIYQTAVMVRKQLPERDIEVVDSKTATLSQGIIVLEAAKMAKEGKTKEKIISYVKSLRSKSMVFATLDDLTTLYHSGRVNLTQKLLAQLFHFKAIFWLIEGQVRGAGRIRDKQSLFLKMKELGIRIKKHLLVKTIFVIHANRREEAEILANYLKEEAEDIEIFVGEFGLVAGAHTGPGLLGLAWIGDFDPKWFFKSKRRQYKIFKRITEPEKLDYVQKTK